MTEEKRDSNQVSTMMGVLSTDGLTPTRIEADPTSHELDILDGTTGSDFSREIAGITNNGVRALCATDSNGKIIPLYVDSNGQLLVSTV